jgi:hypothetical protein
MVKFSVCVLLYGDHYNLALRCLESLVVDEGYQEHVQDFRIGLNNVCRETYDHALSWGDHVSGHGVPVIYYMPDLPPGQPYYKYPVMRDMFLTRGPLAENVMWFDDDSYLTGMKGWWKDTAFEATLHMAMGQIWQVRVQGNQKEFFKTQPWYRHELGTADDIRFLQGSWWTIRTHLLDALDWPIAELKHCGGDSMLGEAFRHQGVNLHHYDKGVRLNADAKGRHSKSARRGYSEPHIGYDYDGKPYPTDHYLFPIRKWVARCDSPKT